jgi:hypothetical protein
MLNFNKYKYSSDARFQVISGQYKIDYSIKTTNRNGSLKSE